MYETKLTLRGVTHTFTNEAEDIQIAEYKALDRAFEMYGIYDHEWHEIETIYIGERRK